MYPELFDDSIACELDQIWVVDGERWITDDAQQGCIYLLNQRENAIDYEQTSKMVQPHR